MALDSYVTTISMDHDTEDQHGNSSPSTSSVDLYGDGHQFRDTRILPDHVQGAVDDTASDHPDMPSTSRDDDDNEGCCAVCSESRRYLKMLPCGHCFCEYCLQSLVNQHSNNSSTRSFPCPSCRTETPAPMRGASEFPIYTPKQEGALRFEEMVSSLKVMTEHDVSQLCEDCREDNSEYMCVQCERTVCNWCRHGHNGSQHLLVLLTAAPTGNQYSDDRCSLHRFQKLLYFCSECEELLCETCKKKTHSKHTVVDLGNAASAARAELERTKLNVERVLHHLSVVREDLMAQKQSIQEDVIQMERNVRRRAAGVRDMVTCVEENTVKDLKDTFSRAEIQLRRAQNTVEDRIAGVSHILKHMGTAMSSNSLPSVVRMNTSARASVGNEGFLKKYTNGLPCKAYVLHLEQDPGYTTNLIKKHVGVPRLNRIQHKLPVVKVITSVELISRDYLAILSVCPVKNDKAWMTYKPEGDGQTTTTIGFCHLGTGEISSTETVEGPVTLSTDYNGVALVNAGHVQMVLHPEGLHQELEGLPKNDRMLFPKGKLRGWLWVHNSSSSIKLRLVDHPIHNMKDVLAEMKYDFIGYCEKIPRRFDMNSDGSLLVVVNATDTIHFVKKSVFGWNTFMELDPADNAGLIKEVADVCFYTLGGREVLLLADRFSDDVMVLEVLKRQCFFIGHLTNMSGCLRYPSALNVDPSNGALLVACGSKSIVVCRETGLAIDDSAKICLETKCL